MPPKLPKYVVTLSLVGTTVGGYVLFKDKLGGGMYRGDERVAGRTIVITGTTSGMGKATAMEMAKRDEKRLDVLINNAGVMMVDKKYTEDGFEKHLGVNYLGPYLLTHLLLDKLKSSAPSRIINTGSFGYQRASLDFENFNMADDYHHKDAYMRSKLALSMFTRYLSEHELKDTEVNTYLIIPGLTDTNLTCEMPMRKSFLSRIILAPLWWVLLNSPEQGIQQTLHCALSPDEANHSGQVYNGNRMIDLEGASTSEKARKRLDLISKKWTRLS